MLGRTSASYGHSTTRRAVAAAVIATAALLLAANAGPARASTPPASTQVSTPGAAPQR
ncbi:hypothetical protein [Streptomyces sp. AF1A]|uniref:hypothetical protein n=1 Tax=Streptomyces sp. AF1A TaxID=3394350 RepID=UPI0039BC8D1C